MALNEYEIKKQICDIGKRIYDRNMVAANDGNISVKLNDNEFLCTPTGVSKGFMTPEFICKVDANGNVIQANKGFRPSSEIKMHMRVYKKRPSTMEIPDAVEPYLEHFDAVLLESHGALTWSTDLLAAYMKMESVEFYAELLYKARQLGGPKEFSPENVQKLYEIRRKMGLPGRHPADLCQNKGKANCHNCGSCSSSADSQDSQELVAAITKKVLEQLGK